MTDTKDIQAFIDNVAQDPHVRTHFATDLSYWWANIMFARFSESTGDKSNIIYNPTIPRFGIVINGYAFDAYGNISNQEIDDYMGWEYYYTNHPEGANYTLRDMVYLVPDKNWEEFCHRYGKPPEEDK